MSFNSRTREGATSNVFDVIKINPVSIHAPVRVRHGVPAECFGVESFNSRTREGATPQKQPYKEAKNVSIHAPVRVRRFLAPSLAEGNVSIHAPVRVRPACKPEFSRLSCFNSRTREGATL